MIPTHNPFAKGGSIEYDYRVLQPERGSILAVSWNISKVSVFSSTNGDNNSIYIRALL